ncbi:hypothetical protein GCM10008943_32600 [Paenochrobactrum glaciei]|uniref:Uncharacterized protein n=1 Tax=Paenochrobactrum glaciei TaxID=486407 RepID=A0ABN1GN41_9HYPH
MESKIDDLYTKVTEKHQLLTQAKGALWVLMLMIAVGGFIAGEIVPIVQYLSGR